MERARHHATLHASPTGALRVVDERSRNGTLVNGAAVTDAPTPAAAQVVTFAPAGDRLFVGYADGRGRLFTL